MKLVRQPPNSNLCGQACIATIFGITLEEAIKAVGKKGKTYGSDLRRAIQSLGGDATAMVRVKNEHVVPAGTGIIKFKQGKAGHFVVFNKGKYYDPASGVFRERPKYLAGAKPTSYMNVSGVFRVAINQVIGIKGTANGQGNHHVHG
jgi:hypothetical protein